MVVAEILEKEVPEKVGRFLTNLEVTRLNKLGHELSTLDKVARVNPIDPDYGQVARVSKWGWTFANIFVARHLS
jgi:hypothetical protein